MPDPLNETKQLFIQRYTDNSKHADLFQKHSVALPCDCQDGGGLTHWAAVSRDPFLVHIHLQYYAPKGTPWPDEIPPYKEGQE